MHISTGHYYVVGECGRPLEEGRCPECQGAIGGQNHALIETNRHAPEMDEAEGPVWSEERDFQLAMLLQEQEYVSSSILFQLSFTLK